MSADRSSNPPPPHRHDGEPRVAATVRLTLQGLQAKDVQQLYTANVGRGGVFVRCDQVLPVGTRVRFEMLCGDGSEPLTGEADVVWLRPPEASDPQHPSGMGLRFTELSPATRQLFEELVASESAAPLDLGEPLELGEPLPAEEAATAAAPPLSEVADDETGDELVTLPTSYSVLDTVIGIDLGTSNSCVAVIKDGKPFIIPTENQEATVPSVVSFSKGGEILVGKPAKDQLCNDPKNTVYGAKRFIGRPFNSPIVRSLKGTFPYEIIPGDKGQVAIQIRGEVVNLETISAHILSYLKQVAQEYIELEVTKAIITVPAYYNDNQRQAVKEAGRMAGLDVQRIVNEPTAAALSYGFNRGMKTRIMVYDLGGGTFDVSILELQGNNFQVLACGGNNFLGGEDFDNTLTDYIVATYEREQKLNLAHDRVVRERIKQAAEFAKRHLSEVSQTKVNVPYIKTADGRNINLQLPITRDLLNEITGHLVTRTLQLCDAVLEGVSMGKTEIDEIILVGGQTRMPLVRQQIEKHFSKRPRMDLNPDEVVAMGATLLGVGLKQAEKLKLRDSISISIGIALPGNRFKPIIRANTAVPVVKQYKIKAAARSPEEAFHIDVFQGESQSVTENEYLGTLLFSDLPVGEPTPMNIEFHVTEECILKVVAIHPETGKSEEALLVTYDTPPSLKENVAPPADLK